jgi:hypothetical protein
MLYVIYCYIQRKTTCEIELFASNSNHNIEFLEILEQWLRATKSSNLATVQYIEY